MMYTIIVAANEETVLQKNLLSSPIASAENIQLIIQKNYRSASLAYNEGLAKAKSDICLLVHQDVFIPPGWQKRLEEALEKLAEKPWAVLGLIGTNPAGRVVGRTWSTGLKKEVGNQIGCPELVKSIDELLIVVNKKAGVYFDQKLPGFHLYGTDIVQAAIKNGFLSYVIDAPVIHNSLPCLKLDQGFAEAYYYLQKKWWNVLPIKTLVTSITRSDWSLRKRLIRQMFCRNNRFQFQRLDDPLVKAKELGYE